MKLPKNVMPFPKEYKKKLKKNTVVCNKEIGKYKKNETYEAGDYKGNLFNLKVKIKKIVITTLDKIKKYIPNAELNCLKPEQLKAKSKVNVIWLEIIKTVEKEIKI